MLEKMIFGGNAHPELTHAIADHLKISVGKARVGQFSDGEIDVEILMNVRGHDVFIIQPTSTPTNQNIMELIFLADALRRSSAARITAVLPYYGYARQDRRVRSARVPISAKVIADMMASVGISRMLTVDLHADQIQGFFYMPVDNIYCTPPILEDIKANQIDNIMIVSPDVGGVVRARAIAKRLNNLELAIIDKRRPKPNEIKVMHIIGDVNKRNCILIDDIVDTAGTLCSAANALKENGALTVRAYVTHPVLSGPALDHISRAALDEVIVTNTVPLSKEAASHPKIRQISISKMIAEAIQRINEEESISEMFPD